MGIFCDRSSDEADLNCVSIHGRHVITGIRDFIGPPSSQPLKPEFPHITRRCMPHFPPASNIQSYMGGSRVRLCRRRTRVNPKLQWKACGLLTWKRSACLEKLGRIGNGLQFKIFSVFPQSSIIPTVASSHFFFAILWDKLCMWKILDNHSRNSHEKTNLHPSS